MKLLLSGDLHGNNEWFLKEVLPMAISKNVDLIFVLGDFGLMDHIDREKTRLDALNDALVACDLDLVFLDGNHDNHDLLIDKRKYPLSLKHKRPFTTVRSNVFYAYRGKLWEIEGSRGLIMGGAVSVDRQRRIAHEIETGEKIWWESEAIKPHQIRKAATYCPVDFILSHDAPLLPPVGNAEFKHDEKSQKNRDYIYQLVKLVGPTHLFHGHYHSYYTGSIAYQMALSSNYRSTQIVGLGGDKTPGSLILLNIPSLKYEVLNPPK